MQGDQADIPAAQKDQSFADQFLTFLDQAGKRGPFGFDILDVGTGLARIPVAICRQRSDVAITALDRSPRLLARARREIAAARLSDRIDLHLADAELLPCADGAFDAVISNSVVHHLSDPVAALREMMRVLKPTGILFVRDSRPQADFARVATVLSRLKERRPQPARRRHTALLTPLSLAHARIAAKAAGLPPRCAYPAGPGHWIIAADLANRGHGIGHGVESTGSAT